VNTTIQGTAADLMKMAMLRVDGALREAAPGAHMLLQVHDELLFEVPQSQVEAAASAIREAMEGVHPLRIRLAVDQKVGRSWLEVT
jgi:DNA polymerase-1